MRRMLALLMTAALFMVGGAAAASADTEASSDSPGQCPAGYTKIADDYKGGKSWTADRDYSSVILVGGPPSADQNNDPDGRDKVFSDVQAGQTISRVAHEISHICGIVAPPPPVVTYDSLYELDCEYVLTETVITFTDGVETSRATLAPRVIDAAEAAELGVSLPEDCEEPVVTTESSYVLDCEYMLTETVITFTDGVETSRETLDARLVTPAEAAELGVSLPDDCEVLEERVEFEYTLDCDFLLTGEKVTYLGEEEIDRETLTPRTIDAAEAEALGVALPEDCEEPVVTTESTYVLDCEYMLVETVITFTDGEETSRETLDARQVTPAEAAELGVSLPDDCEVLGEVTEFEYALDCDYLLTGDKVTYVDGVETAREALTPRTITEAEAAELGVALPDDCDVPVFSPAVSVSEPVCVEEDDELFGLVEVVIDNRDSTVPVWFAVWVDEEPVADIELEAGDMDVIELLFGEAGSYDVVVEAIGDEIEGVETYAAFTATVVVDCVDEGSVVQPGVVTPVVKPVAVTPTVTPPTARPTLASTGADGVAPSLMLAALLLGLGAVAVRRSRSLLHADQPTEG